MNSRERVLAAVNFKKPDRVPIDLSAIRASGINAVVYDQLKRRMGLRTPTKVWDAMQILAQVEPEVIDRLHVDVLPLDVKNATWQHAPASTGRARRLFCGLEVYFPPYANIVTEPDGGWAMLDAAGKPFARMPKDGYYFDFVRTTMAGSRIDPAAFKPSDTVSDEELRQIEACAKRLYEGTDKALLGWGPSVSFMGLSALLSDNITQGALDEWLCMLMAEKQTAHDMMGRFVDAVIKKLVLVHQAVGERCFAWGVASDDAGTQIGELIAPDLFAEMVIPHYRRLCDWVHRHTPWKTYLHSCGSIYHYIGHWIDAGIDILNPVQISAARMAPAELMAAYGGKIVFWGGGCDTQRVLPQAKPDEVRAHVRENIRTFARNGTGFVFTQVHNIQQNVPVENVEVMFDEAYRAGRAVCQEP